MSWKNRDRDTNALCLENKWSVPNILINRYSTWFDTFTRIHWHRRYSHLYWDIWSDLACWMIRVHVLLNLVLVKVRASYLLQEFMDWHEQGETSSYLKNALGEVNGEATYVLVDRKLVRNKVDDYIQVASDDAKMVLWVFRWIILYWVFQRQSRLYNALRLISRIWNCLEFKHYPMARDNVKRW